MCFLCGQKRESLRQLVQKPYFSELTSLKVERAFPPSTFMQVSAASLRMHAACVALPIKAPVSAWAATRRLVASKSSRTLLHTVKAAEQRTASEDPSNVDIKGRSNEDKQATSKYINNLSHRGLCFHNDSHM